MRQSRRVFSPPSRGAQLEISLAALDQIEARVRQGERQWRLRLERVQYEADLSRRRFVAVEPENRLVARSLERDWNEKLADVERFQREYLARPINPLLPMSAEQRSRLLALAQDIPLVWRASTTKQAERKQLLRYLIKDVTLSRRETTIQISIRWQTEAFTQVVRAAWTASALRPRARDGSSSRRRSSPNFASRPAVAGHVRLLRRDNRTVIE